MGSELNNDAVGPDAARRLPRGAGVRGAGVRAADAFGGGSAVSGLAGSNVTPCETGSLPSIVASASRLRAAPQEEQKRPSAEFLAPQQEQSMGRRDSIIADQRSVANFVISTSTLGRMTAAVSCQLGRCWTLLLRGGRNTGAHNSKTSKRQSRYCARSTCTAVP